MLVVGDVTYSFLTNSSIILGDFRRAVLHTLVAFGIDSGYMLIIDHGLFIAIFASMARIYEIFLPVFLPSPISRSEFLETHEYMKV